MGDDTTVRVGHDTWRRLHSRKDPGDSMNDVIADLLDVADEEPSDGSPQPAET